MGSKPSIIQERSVVLEQPPKPQVEPVNVPVRARSPQELTCKEMEMEFDKLYEKSKEILGSLNSNPCHELTQRITECLENNSMQMGKCFAVMDDYRVCVREEVNERLAVRNGKDAILRPKVHEIEQLKDEVSKKIEETLLKVDEKSAEKNER